MYWRLRYNVDWLTYKVPALLAAGARRVILPRTDAMVAMEKQVPYKGSLLEPRNHPLWLATEESGVEPDRGCHRTHMDNLIENGPFMVYETGCIPTRRGLGTKGGGGLSAAVRGYEVVGAFYCDGRPRFVSPRNRCCTGSLGDCPLEYAAGASSPHPSTEVRRKVERALLRNGQSPKSHPRDRRRRGSSSHV